MIQYRMLKEKSLVLYKQKPAIIQEYGEKLLVQTISGESLKLRPKDVQLLHPGPCASFSDLEGTPEGDIAEALEILSGAPFPVKELAELAWGAYTPQTAWAVYTLLQDGLYLSGTLEALEAKTIEEIEAEQHKRQHREQEASEREDFLNRLKAGKPEFPADRARMQDIEALALGKSDKSKTLKDIGKKENPEEAHKLLLATGYWEGFFNPHPSRFGLLLKSAKEEIPPSHTIEREDLRYLEAWAIDNEWSSDPDDAISLEGNTVHIHIADPAAAIPTDSICDMEARGRGATLYIPEGSFRMLSEDAVARFALGLSEESFALTISVSIDEQLQLLDARIRPSIVKVSRLSYQKADERSEDSALAPLFALAKRLEQKRIDAGAVMIELPEVHISVIDDKPEIQTIPQTRSSAMVREFMLLAGEAAARWAMREQLPFPYVLQETTDLPNKPAPGIAGAFQLRRCMRGRQLSAKPGAHAGLGLGMYTQISSPLRRYTDLVCHQQIYRMLEGQPLMSHEEILQRIAAGEAAARQTVLAERASRQHWTLCWMQEHPDTIYEAVVTEKKAPRCGVFIPAIAWETQIALTGEFELNDSVHLRCTGVSLHTLEARFTQEAAN